MDQNITLRKERALLGRRDIIGGFTAAHGIMHALLLTTPRPDGGVGNFVTRGGDVQLLSSLGLGAGAIDLMGAALTSIVTVCFVISAMAYLRQRRGWEGWLLFSSTLSIVLLSLFWNDWMIVGPLIDLGLMALALRSMKGVTGA
ncbi:MAG: hypothetical protein SA339_03230 [Methanomassiliicoccus sp.]|nr:hypothetical protein [Methanomassiliicoccus sp.]